MLRQTLRLRRAREELQRTPDHNNSPPHSGNQNGDSGQGKRKALQLPSWLLLAISLVLSYLSYYKFYPNHLLLAGVTALAALAFSSWVGRGPWRRNGQLTTVVARLLFLLQLIKIVSVTVSGMRNSVEPFFLLGLAIFGIVGVGISIWLLMTWLPKWPYKESLAIGLMAVSLGVLCLPGLRAVTQTLQSPYVNGAGQLYIAKETAQQKVSFGVCIDNCVVVSNISGIPIELFTITNEGSAPVKWALLLVGDARVRLDRFLLASGFRSGCSEGTPGTIANSEPSESGGVIPAGVIPPGIPAPDITGGTPTPAHAQLFSCTLDHRGSSASIGGLPYRTFVSSNFVHSAFSLPTYGQGMLDSAHLGPEFASLIKKALNGPWPTTYDPNLTVSVYGAGLGRLETITQSSSPASLSSENPQWTGNPELSVSYTTTRQDAQDKTTNVLFVFGILLGAAVAGIFTSVQLFIGRYFESKTAK